MARTVGIDAGDFEVRVVELDGSYRKTRLLRARVVPLPVGETGEADAATIADVVAETLREGKFGGAPVLGHPCREAVLRTIDLPFEGEDAIAKVVKAEVEGVIHSHAVDDMVVDFHVIGPGPEGTRVLVAAVPKPSLRPMLQELERLSIEPEHVDLDTMALFRTAEWCGAFAPDAPTAGDGDEGAAAGGEVVPVALAAPATAAGAPPVTVVLDLAGRSTRVLLAEGGRLVDMRTLRLGEATIAEAIARSQALPLAAAREAVHACLTTGDDFAIDVDETPPVAADDVVVEDLPDAPVAAPTMRRVDVAREAVEAEQTVFLQRLARELVRFMTSTGRAGAVRAVWMTGGGSRLAGVQEVVREVFGCAPRELDVLARLQHSLPPEEAEALAPHLAVPVGLALFGQGGVQGFDFRQEDLAFTRGFDRLKFPLAIACMVAVFAAVVFGVDRNNRLKNLHYELGATYTGDKADPKKPAFFGMLAEVFGRQWFSNDRFFNHEVGNRVYGEQQLLQDVAAKPEHERLRFVRDKLRHVLDEKQKESGIYDEVSLESGLAVLARMFEVLDRAEPGMGKYLLCEFSLDMKVTGSGRNSRNVTFKIAFPGEDFRTRQGALLAAIEEECKREGSPFVELDEKSRRDELFKVKPGEPEVFGAYSTYKIFVKDSFDPFKEVRG